MMKREDSISLKSLKRRNTVLLVLEALMVYGLMAVLMGSFHEEFFKHEAPCPLCYLQRIAFVGSALGALMNLRFGIKTKYIAVSLLFSVFGNIVSTRQILLHICPGMPKFGYPVYGLNLYTWAYLIFAFVILSQIILLFFSHARLQELPHPKLRWWESLAFLLVVLCTVGNMASALIECDFGMCQDVPWPPTENVSLEIKSE